MGGFDVVNKIGISAKDKSIDTKINKSKFNYDSKTSLKIALNSIIENHIWFILGKIISTFELFYNIFLFTHSNKK